MADVELLYGIMVPYNGFRQEEPHMAEERLEVRLDPERGRKLRKIAETRGVTLSYAVREMIDTAIEDDEREERHRAVERIANANVEDVPDPEELSRQLDATHDLPDLY
jgi:predicted DNA-binding protein